MLEIFYTKKPVLSEAFIKNILTAYYNIPNPTICKTIHGKPYLIKSKICFNLTHSKGLTALAVGKHQIGFDCESLSGKPRPAVLSKFTEREKGEILTVQDFYRHWTAPGELHQISRRTACRALAESRILPRQDLSARRRCGRAHPAIRNGELRVQHLRRLYKIQHQMAWTDAEGYATTKTIRQQKNRTVSTQATGKDAPCGQCPQGAVFFVLMPYAESLTSSCGTFCLIRRMNVSGFTTTTSSSRSPTISTTSL